jgi:hypothetical protein
VQKINFLRLEFNLNDISTEYILSRMIYIGSEHIYEK